MNYGGGRFSRKKLDPTLTVSFLMWYACLEKEKKEEKKIKILRCFFSFDLPQLAQPPVFLDDDTSSAHLNEIIIIAFCNFYLKTNSSIYFPKEVGYY